MPISSRRAPESFARVPSERRREGAGEARAQGGARRQPGRDAVASQTRASTTTAASKRQEDEDDRPGEAVGRELQPALGDLGEIVEPAGVEHRAGQVGVGP